jgi:hypothetical protein
MSYFSGNDLYRRCQSNDYYEQGMCLGLVIGAIDEWQNWREGAHLPPCVPSTVETGQLRDVVVKYLEDHPKLRDQSAWALVVQATVRAWNCK